MGFIKTLFYITEITGTIAFAVSGAIHALKKKLDIFGVIIIGLVTAFGGGAIRDIILGTLPPKMFYNYKLVTLAIATCIIVFTIAYFAKKTARIKQMSIETVYIIVDALGLAAFSVSGMQAAIVLGHKNNIFICVSLGIITATGGGVLRDMLSREIPVILRKNVYATASMLGCLIYFMLYHLKINQTVSTLLAMTIIVVIRLLAVYYKWNLPKVDKNNIVFTAPNETYKKTS